MTKPKTITIEPYTSKIAKLTDKLDRQSIPIHRNLAFEKADIKLMFYGIIDQLFHVHIDDKTNVITLHIESKSATKHYVFKTNDQLLLWIYQRLETISIIKQNASIDDQLIYASIVNQLLQIEQHFVKQTN